MARQCAWYPATHSFVKRLLLWILLLVLWPLLAQAEQFTGKVVGVREGDSLVVVRAGRRVRVRLYGIDCPRSRQAFSTQARAFTREVALQQTVAVVADTPLRSGWLVAVVQLPDGRDLSQALVQAGYAWHDPREAPYYTKLAQMEAEARDAHRGLWAEAHPIPPWEWRRGRRPPSSASESQQTFSTQNAARQAPE